VGQTNAELVSQSYAAWNRGDWDGVFALFDPEIEVRPPEMWPEAGAVRGRENVRNAFRAVLEAVDRPPVMELGEILEVDDQVLAQVLRSTGRGRGSGIYLEVPFSQVFSIRDGRISRMDFYLDHADAREAVGLPSN
jgi:ketosteroid isomerase-like protein